MSLIDADYFKQQIAAATLKNNIEPRKGLALIELVDAQPTAYDVDKVMEQLKAEGCIVDDAAGNRAAEIIKAGGVNE